jgi:hypothetical protein
VIGRLLLRIGAWPTWKQYAFIFGAIAVVYMLCLLFVPGYDPLTGLL